MKDFGEWFNNAARRPEWVVPPKPAAAPTDPVKAAREALEAAVDDLDVRIVYMVKCCACEKQFEWPDQEIEHFVAGVNNYCGGSPRCCP